jgi:hypothetical protein
MSDNIPTEPVGLDKHDPAGMAAWLRERARINREWEHITPEATLLLNWQRNVMPHLSFRFEQAAEMIERLCAENVKLLDQNIAMKLRTAVDVPAKPAAYRVGNPCGVCASGIISSRGGHLVCANCGWYPPGSWTQPNTPQRG